MTSNTILIIDDDQELVNELSDILKDEHYHVRAVTNGQAGLQSFQETIPDLVLLDMKLPGIDGLKLLEEFKQRAPQIPVFILSGRPVFSPLTQLFPKDLVIEESRLLLADQFFNKPFEITTLLSRIHTQLQPDSPE